LLLLSLGGESKKYSQHECCGCEQSVSHTAVMHW